MDSIDDLLTSYFKLKDKYDKLKSEVDSKRGEIYNELTNINKSNYSNDYASVTKTEDRTYLTVTKADLFDAIENAQLTKQQKEEIMNNAFRETTKTGSIIIRRK